MKARRWLQVWHVLLIASGCVQRADWIEGTLVTVDVAGRWAGTYSGGLPGGDVDMTLRQTGPKATGDIRLTGVGPVVNPSGPIEGTVTGDVLRFSRTDGGLRGEVIVAGDAMSGTVTFGSTGTRTLWLQRQQPAGQPESR